MDCLTNEFLTLANCSLEHLSSPRILPLHCTFAYVTRLQILASDAKICSWEQTKLVTTRDLATRDLVLCLCSVFCFCFLFHFLCACSWVNHHMKGSTLALVIGKILTIPALISYPFITLLNLLKMTLMLGIHVGPAWEMYLTVIRPSNVMLVSFGIT